MRSLMISQRVLILDGDGMPDSWNPGFLAEESTSGLALDNDDDNDGWIDFDDEDPLDPNQGQLSFQTALNQVIDITLRHCIEHNSAWDNNREFASDVTEVHCGGTGVGSAQGIERFSNIRYLDLNNPHLSDLGPIGELRKLEYLDIDNGSRSIYDLTPPL